MERITNLPHNQFWELFNNPLNHALNENQKNILFKLKDQVDSLETQLPNVQGLEIVAKTEEYQKALDMLNKMIKMLIQGGLIYETHSAYDCTKRRKHQTGLSHMCGEW